MFFEFVEGSLLWSWYHSSFGMFAFWITLFLAAVILGLRDKRNLSVLAKATLLSSVVATLPLGLTKMGLGIVVTNNALITELSIAGFAASLIIGIPFLLIHLTRQSFGSLQKPDNLYIAESTGALQKIFHKGTSGISALGKTRIGAARHETVKREPVLDQDHMSGTLNIQEGPRSGEQFTLNGKPLNIGRSESNDVVINDPTLSRHHAQIINDGQNFYIKDLDSKAGSFINGRSVSHDVIPSGSSIKVGQTVMNLHSNKPELMLDPSDPPPNMRGHDFGSAADPMIQEMQVADFVMPDNDTKQRDYYEEEEHLESLSDSINEKGDVRVLNRVNSANDGTRRVARESSSNVWITFTDGPNRGQGYRLSQGDNKVGRSVNNDIVVDDPFVSRHQALIQVSGDEIYLFDQGGSERMLVNGKPVEGITVEQGAALVLGESRLGLLSIGDGGQSFDKSSEDKTLFGANPRKEGMLVVQSGPDSGKCFQLTKGANSVGRDGDCDVQLTDPTVSRKHALIRHSNSAITVYDMGSKSGTLVNGVESKGYRVRPTDVIQMGRSKFSMVTK